MIVHHSPPRETTPEKREKRPAMMMMMMMMMMTTTSATKRHDRVLAYDEQFLRRLDTLENRARRLRLFPQDTKDDFIYDDDDDFTIESVKKHVLKGCALNEESSPEEENVFRGAFQTTLGGRADVVAVGLAKSMLREGQEKMER